MAAGAMSMVIQRLQSQFGAAAGMTDGELLARFLESRDEDALAALVRRHAPMVWGVCRRVLNHHDAEDAFQASFLVLVRKAADVPRRAVANWLYGVARQTAVRLRALAATRRRRETQVVNMPEPKVAEVRDADLLAILDEELSRLPDHYRGVIVLCDLEDMTRKKAAQQLGIAEGSVASRLARARALLAKRLTRRGVVFSGGSLAAVLSAASASGFAPPALVASTIKAASLVAVGQTASAVSASVAALTEGVVKAMFVTKIKSVLAVVLVAGLALGGIGAGVGLFTNTAVVAQDKGAGKAPADKAVDADVMKRAEADVKQAEALVEVAKAQLEQAQANYQYRKQVLERLQELDKKAKEGKKLSKTDQERMVGNWFIMNDDSGRKGEMWVITEDTILMHAKNLGVNAYRYFHRVDAAKTPKQIDITVKKVKGQSVGVIKGIYVLDGDELRLYLAAQGKDRPAAFPDKPKPGEVLILQRAMPDGTPPQAKQEQPAVTDMERMMGGWVIVNDDSKRKGEEWLIGMHQIVMHPNLYGFPVACLFHHLDHSKNPKQIDITVTSTGGGIGGPVPRSEKHQIVGVIKGIYQLDRGELRLCLGEAGKDRPAAFPDKPKPGEVLILHGGPEPKVDGGKVKLRVLIDKVLAAHGGEDKLIKLKFFTETVKHSNLETQYYFVQPPKNFRWETTHPDRTSKRIVILFPEGRRWWTKEPNGQPMEFRPTGAERTMEYHLDYVKFFGPRQVLRLKDADHRVALLDDEIKIGDRAAVGVEVTGPEFKRKMFFDKETHLLLKSGAITYSDYKKFDGIPVAQKENDGYLMPQVTDFRAVDKFDATLFKQP
jgi:RNA polymerase sigma factor (sigma-70 family)